MCNTKYSVHQQVTHPFNFCVYSEELKAYVISTLLYCKILE
jgi:hypothetical protein